MKRSDKVKKNEKILEGGKIDIYEMIDFLTDEYKHYKKIIFISEKNYCCKFNIIGDLFYFTFWNSRRHELISNYRLDYFAEILKLEEIRRLLDQSWSICLVDLNSNKTPQVKSLWCFCILYT